MLDHVFLPVTDLKRSMAFYDKALTPLGFDARVDYDGSNGPPGHPDLKGFGKNGRLVFWLGEGQVAGTPLHVGFFASSREEVQAAYQAAMQHGATDNGAPGIRSYYDPRYFAANV